MAAHLVDLCGLAASGLLDVDLDIPGYRSRELRKILMTQDPPPPGFDIKQRREIRRFTFSRQFVVLKD